VRRLERLFGIGMFHGGAEANVALDAHR
jgi:hypothetical protein